MNTDNYLRNKLYRAGLAAGGAIFALSFLGPVFEQAVPFIPLVITIVSGLVAGLLVKAIFKALVNKKINQSYRYSSGGVSAGKRW
jgi:purine-cytosine permease-like protein